VAGLLGGQGRFHRPWALHEEAENSEKVDSVDTSFVHSANIASSILMQWSREMMFAIVFFQNMSPASGSIASRPLLGAVPLDPAGGLLFPRPPCSAHVENVPCHDVG